MFGRDPLVEFADRDGAGGLQEARARSVNFSMSILMSLFLGDGRVLTHPYTGDGIAALI